MNADRSAAIVDADEAAAPETEDQEFEVTPVGDFKTAPEATTASIYGCR